MVSSSEPPLDLDALNRAQAELLSSLTPGGRPEFQKREQAHREILEEANLSDEARAERAAKQEAHTARLEEHRKATAEIEAAKEAERRSIANKSAPGTMGIGRVDFECGGVVVAQYILELGDLEIFVPLPAGVRAKQLAVDVGVRSLKVGLKGQRPYLDAAFVGRVEPDSVVWTVEGGELHLEITKAGSSGSSELLAWKGCLEPLPEGRVCEWTQ